MGKEYVAFLRAISNVPMQPFREALSDIGLTDVSSFGGTGNLLFSAEDTDRAALERRVTDAVGAEAFIRSRSELALIVAENPFADRPGAGLFFAHSQFSQSRVTAFLADGFEGESPVVSGAEVYFVDPLRRAGHTGSINLERELGVRGTMRASRVVARVFELM